MSQPLFPSSRGVVGDSDRPRHTTENHSDSTPQHTRTRRRATDDLVDPLAASPASRPRRSRSQITPAPTEDTAPTPAQIETSPQPQSSAAPLEGDFISTLARKLPRPPPVRHIYFDGGCRTDQDGDRAAYGVAVVDNGKVVATHAGDAHPATSQVAEVNGAHAALKFAHATLKTATTPVTVEIIGDSFGTINAMATRTEDIRARRGRSAAPDVWKRMGELRERCDEAMRKLEGADITFTWVPRRYNAAADEVATAHIQRRKPEVAHWQPTALPSSAEIPSQEELNAIAQQALNGWPPTWRSLPQAATILWRAILARIAAWGNPWALYLAPLVLLQRGSDSPVTRLQAIAASEQTLRRHFNNAAVASPPRPNIARGAARSEEDRWRTVERLTSQSVAGALRHLDGTPPVPPAEAAISLAPKFGGAADDEWDDPGPETPWLHWTTFVAVTAKSPRARAPGPDRWTRELLLSSVEKASTINTTFETLVNAIARGSAPEPMMQLARAACLAAWRKPTGTGHRVVGMTSAITKNIWRMLTAVHLRKHRLHQCIATFSPGGVLSIVKWARQRGEVVVADVKDAYWAVDRCEVGRFLAASRSPLAKFFKLVYGTTVPVVHGTNRFDANRGLIPGCGGASLLFAVACTIKLTNSRLTARDVGLYADDATGTSDEVIDELQKTMHPFKFAKRRKIKTDGTGTAETGGRLLGAYFDKASLEERVDKCLALAHRVTTGPISAQARMALLLGVERSLRWTLLATSPDIASTLYDRVDTNMANAVLNIALPGAQPTHKTSTLITLPSASGGLGITPFSAFGAQLHDAFMSTASWPPKAAQVEDEIIVKHPPWRELCSTINESIVANSGLPQRAVQARADHGTPWFAIAAVTKHDTIPDDAFQLQLANFLAMKVDYATCSPTDDPYAHAHSCSTCAAPYWFARHETVVKTILEVGRRYGAIGTTNFFEAIGASHHEQHPDALFYRHASEDKPLVIDVTITTLAGTTADNRNPVTRMEYVKQKKYSEWHKDVVDFAPLALTNIATVPTKSMKLLEDMEKKGCALRGFTSNVIRRIKVALIRYEALRRKYLSARFRKTLSGPIGEEESSAPA